MVDQVHGDVGGFAEEDDRETGNSTEAIVIYIVTVLHRLLTCTISPLRSVTPSHSARTRFPPHSLCPTHRPFRHPQCGTPDRRSSTAHALSAARRCETAGWPDAKRSPRTDRISVALVCDAHPLFDVQTATLRRIRNRPTMSQTHHPHCRRLACDSCGYVCVSSPPSRDPNWI